MRKSDLLSAAMEITAAQAKERKTNRNSVNARILDLLFKQKLTLSKQEIITRLALERLQQEYDDNQVELTKEEFTKVETQKKFKEFFTTVKNGFEQSYSNGQNNASFHNNPTYKKAYVLVRTKNDGNTMNDTFTIREKK